MRNNNFKLGRLFLVGIFLFIAFPNSLFAQEPATPQDSTRTGHVIGERSFPHSISIISVVEYAPILTGDIDNEKFWS